MICHVAEVGLIVSGFGVLFLAMGVGLLFDAALLALGNVLLSVGFMITIGLQNIASLITNLSRLPGTICFILGMYMVITGWARIGIIIEFIGIITLFINFFPFVFWFIEWIPFIGPILSRMKI